MDEKIKIKQKVMHTIGDTTFRFNPVRIKKYPKKEDFFNDIYASHPNVDKAELKKVLEKVWEEVFPAKTN
ncbi:MAG: hypothetical protein LBG96_16750 [Tannerella sp.]|jgi:hypothetical protein|nr:hypothetical protein [Tannerella sp.]